MLVSGFGGVLSTRRSLCHGCSSILSSDTCKRLGLLGSTCLARLTTIWRPAEGDGFYIKGYWFLRRCAFIPFRVLLGHYSIELERSLSEFLFPHILSTVKVINDRSCFL